MTDTTAETNTKSIVLDSLHLLTVARISYERSGRTPADALVAILFSAAAVEAFVNEFPELLFFLGRGIVPPEMRALEQLLRVAEDQSASVTLKLQIIAASASGKALDKSRQPYQDYSLLISLRNRLVHLKPTVVTSDSSETGRSKKDILKQLASRGVALNPTANPASWIREISTQEVARWAYNAGAGMFLGVIDLLPEGMFKVMARMSVEKIKLI